MHWHALIQRNTANARIIVDMFSAAFEFGAI